MCRFCWLPTYSKLVLPYKLYCYFFFWIFIHLFSYGYPIHCHVIFLWNYWGVIPQERTSNFNLSCRLPPPIGGTPCIVPIIKADVSLTIQERDWAQEKLVERKNQASNPMHKRLKNFYKPIDHLRGGRMSWGLELYGPNCNFLKTI